MTRDRTATRASLLGTSAEGAKAPQAIEMAVLPDPYVCQRCHRLYPYLDLMCQPECECGSESFFYVPNGAEASWVIARNYLDSLLGELPEEAITVVCEASGHSADSVVYRRVAETLLVRALRSLREAVVPKAPQTEAEPESVTQIVVPGGKRDGG